MTDEFKKYIYALAVEARNHTYHNEYDLRIEFSETPKDSDDGQTTTEMTIKVDQVYLWARLTIFPQTFHHYELGDYRGIAHSMVHEMCHIFLEPVVDLFMWDACNSQMRQYNDTIERQTQRITNALIDALGREWYLPENLA